QWAYDAGTAALCVDPRDEAARIGPLSLPGRAGCGRCALERLRAAAVTAEPKQSSTRRSPDDLIGMAASALIREIRSILDAGPERSLLLDHVLMIDSDSHEESLHKVIPLARCQVCGGAEAYSIVNHEHVSLS